jgi:MFS transporter, DHA3 family, macrolide efflux protein
VLAASLVAVIGIQGILLVDLATYCWSIATLAAVRIPASARPDDPGAARPSFLSEAGYGWRYIRQRSGLLALLLLFAGSNYAVGLVSVLFTPLILGFTDQASLGFILSVGGSGMLAGSLAMSVWGGPRRRIYGVLVPGLVQGIVISLAGFPPSVPFITGLAFVYFFALPLINGSSQAIWQAKVHPDIQGRVFAIRRMIAWSSLPLAYLSAGVLADSIFEPRLQPGGAWAGSIGALVGTGPGRGIAFLFVLLGLALIALALLGFGYAPLRNVEFQHPDASNASEAAPAALPG